MGLYYADIGRTTLSHGHIDVPSMARARGRDLLTQPVLSGGWTIGASASVCPDIGGSAGASQHAAEPYPLPHLHTFLFPLTSTYRPAHLNSLYLNFHLRLHLHPLPISNPSSTLP